MLRLMAQTSVPNVNWKKLQLPRTIGKKKLKLTYFEKCIWLERM